MFEQKQLGNWNFSWAGIVLVVVFVLAVFWIFRQNPPDGSTQASLFSKPVWSEGKIAEGVLEVEAKGFLTFPLDLNKRSTLNAVFTTGDNSKRLAFVVIDAPELEKWKAGHEIRTHTNTGPVPRGTIKKVLEPGSYLVVFDNRASEKAIRITESSIEVE